jgi:hypothetical protein
VYGSGGWGVRAQGRRSGPGGKRLRAAVGTVTLKTTEDEPETLTADAGNEQTAYVGAPVQAKVIEPVKPLKGFTCRL